MPGTSYLDCGHDVAKEIGVGPCDGLDLRRDLSRNGLGKAEDVLQSDNDHVLIPRKAEAQPRDFDAPGADGQLDEAPSRRVVSV
jgi:hypothetical protein